MLYCVVLVELLNCFTCNYCIYSVHTFVFVTIGVYIFMYIYIYIYIYIYMYTVSRALKCNRKFLVVSFIYIYIDIYL